MAHVDMNHVRTRGGAPAINDVVAGQVDLMFSPMAIAMPHVKSGRLRALAVTQHHTVARGAGSADRGRIRPEGYEATGWYGIVAPVKTPHAVVMRLNQEIVRCSRFPASAAACELRSGARRQFTGSQMASHVQRGIGEVGPGCAGTPSLRAECCS
jgi:tripartite-type tricarboxylate transporter receptor subunit TctC